jgi:hypothetical protein
MRVHLAPLRPVRHQPCSIGNRGEPGGCHDTRGLVEKQAPSPCSKPSLGIGPPEGPKACYGSWLLQDSTSYNP